MGVLQGIALGVVLSLLMLIYRTSHPQGAVLGQLPGTEAYRDVRRHPEALTFPGLLIWRAGGDLFFASIGHLGEGLKAALAASRPPAKHVLLDADSVNFIDTSACDALLNAIKELQSQGITVAFARVRDQVRERMRLGGRRGCRGLGELPRTRDRWRARLASGTSAPMMPRGGSSEGGALAGRRQLEPRSEARPASIARSRSTRKGRSS